MAREGLMDDCGYNFDVDEDSYNSGFKDGFLTAVDEFVEAIKNAYASMKSVSDVERATANTIAMGIAEQLKEE